METMEKAHSKQLVSFWNWFERQEKIVNGIPGTVPRSCLTKYGNPRVESIKVKVNDVNSPMKKLQRIPVQTIDAGTLM